MPTALWCTYPWPGRCRWLRSRRQPGQVDRNPDDFWCRVRGRSFGRDRLHTTLTGNTEKNGHDALPPCRMLRLLSNRRRQIVSMEAGFCSVNLTQKWQPCTTVRMARASRSLFAVWTLWGYAMELAGRKCNQTRSGAGLTYTLDRSNIIT